MYKSKNYVYQDKVKFDEQGVILIPTVNLNDREGGVKLTKDSSIVPHSMLVPMSEVGHEETLKQYSKQIRDKPEDRFTADTMQLYLSLRLLLKLEVFQPPPTFTSFDTLIKGLRSANTESYMKERSKLTSFNTLIKGLMPANTDSYMKERYFLKADEKTWDKKKLFGATDMLEAKRINISARNHFEEPYSYFILRASATKPSTELQFQLFTNKLRQTEDTQLGKQVLSYYDVFIPPNLRISTEWTKYNFGNELFSDANNGQNPLNMNVMDTTTADAAYSSYSATGHATLHNWFMFKNKLNIFCTMARPYGKDSMMYNCYYVPSLYKDLITNSYFYSNWGASQGTNMTLKVMSIDDIVNKTLGSRKTKDQVRRMLMGDSPKRTEMLRVSYNRDSQLLFTKTNKPLFCDYFCYYIGDPFSSEKRLVRTNSHRRHDLLNCPRIKKVLPTKISDLNFFKSATERTAFVALFNKAIKTSIFEAARMSSENQTIDICFDKTWLAWSWQRFQDISPTNPSLNHLTRPYFIYQNDCRRRIVTGKQEGFTIIASGQLDFSKPYTDIDNVNYASMVVDCRVSGVIRSDVFSDEISFKIVDLVDRAPPPFIPAGKTEKLPFRSVLIAYSNADMGVTYRNVNALSFTSFPTVTENKSNFTISTHNPQFEDFFEPYSLNQKMKFRFNMDNFTMPTLLKPGTYSYTTPRIFVCVKGLEDARKLLTNGTQYRIVGIINLSNEKRWKDLKDTDNHFAFSFSDDSLASPNGQVPIDIANLGMSFITNNYSDLGSFNVYLLNNKMTPLEFGNTTKFPIINYTVSVMDTSL